MAGAARVACLGVALTLLLLGAVRADDAKYLGCYKDSRSRLLGHREKDDYALTPELCRKRCAGFKYFGVEWAKQCFCGNTLRATDKQNAKTSEAACDIACTGDKNRKCGGFWGISLYERPVTDDYLGCYTDSRKTRILEHKEKDDRTMTPELCRERCAGYKYFGVEWGKQCFCGNTLRAPEENAKTSGAACNYACVGDRNRKCGGFWRLSLYRGKAAE